MATVQNLIDDTLMDIGVVRVGGTVREEQQSYVLRKLNSLLASWMTEGIPINNGDLVLNDDFPVDPTETHAIQLALGISLSPGYKVRIDPVTFREADQAKDMLQAKYAGLDEVEIDAALTRNMTYDINTD